MDNTGLKVQNPLTKYLYTKASFAKLPISGTFELSPICNFDCKMCYVKKTPKEVLEHNRDAVTLEQWLKIAEDAKTEGMLYLLLTGGEPLLWHGFWELYEKLSKMGLIISINTNGSMIDEAAVERFKQHPPTRINITLYGASDESYEKLCGVKGVFKKVERAIDMLQAAGISVKLNGSLTPDNVYDLDACVRFARDRGLIFETNTYMYPPVRRDASMIGENVRFTPEEAAYYRLRSYRLQFGEERYKNYLRQIKEGSALPLGLDESCVDPLDGKIRCRAGKAAFWVTWDGWLTPCGMMIHPEVDLQRTAFDEAWKTLTELSEDIVLSGTCNKCTNRELCHSCAAMALTETGEFTGIPRYLCKMINEMKKIAGEELAM